MRLSWLHAKLGDPSAAECEAANEPGAQHRYRFAVPPTQMCDADGLLAAYQAPQPFTRDGLLFLAKDGNYELGVTPLAMLWKDGVCSQYPLDTNSDGSTPERQKVVLALRADTGDVVTGDPQPVSLARLPAQFLASARKGATDSMDDGVDVDADAEGGGVAVQEAGGGRSGWRGSGGLRDGLLLRFAVGDTGLTIQDGLPIAADLLYEGIANQRRGSGADSVTKILFQYYARREPITIEEIGAAVSSKP
jgi:snurportin-1